jgi:hypothetical protein
MAPRDTPTPFDADNVPGSCTPAARNDWRNGVADSMSARTTTESTSDAGYTTAGFSLMSFLSISPLYLGGSPYMARYDLGLVLGRRCIVDYGGSITSSS